MLELYVRPPLPFQTPCSPSRGFLPLQAPIRVVTAAGAAGAGAAGAAAAPSKTGVRGTVQFALSAHRGLHQKEAFGVKRSLHRPPKPMA